MVATWKPKEVEELAEIIKENNVVGLVDIEGIPSKQFQQIRKNISGDASIRVSKNVLMKRAFDKAGVEQIQDHVEGSVGLIFSNLDPFKLNKKLEKNRQSAPAKAGDIAPRDILVPEGDTPLPPGPVIGELQQAGVPAKIDAGKIVVQEDTTIVKEGEIISSDVAQILARLDIEPMEIGLDLKAAYEEEKEIVYTQDVLHIDPEETLSKLQSAYSGAFNLSMNAGIFNTATVKTLLAKAFTNSMNLAINAQIMNEDTIEQFLSEANMQMLSLGSNLGEEALDDELKEKVSNQTKQQEQEEQEEDEEEDEEGSEDQDEEEEEDDDQAAAGMASMFG